MKNWGILPIVLSVLSITAVNAASVNGDKSPQANEEACFKSMHSAVQECEKNKTSGQDIEPCITEKLSHNDCDYENLNIRDFSIITVCNADSCQPRINLVDALPVVHW